MDVETSRDALSLNPELLQLPEVSPLALKDNPHVAEQLYSQWLSLPDTVRLALLHASVDWRRKLVVDWVAATYLEEITAKEAATAYQAAWKLLRICLLVRKCMAATEMMEEELDNMQLGTLIGDRFAWLTPVPQHVVSIFRLSLRERTEKKNEQPSSPPIHGLPPLSLSLPSLSLSRISAAESRRFSLIFREI